VRFVLRYHLISLGARRIGPLLIGGLQVRPMPSAPEIADDLTRQSIGASNCLSAMARGLVRTF
jgi:hypothetical protein